MKNANNDSHKKFPIECFNLDHYTLIVPNAKKVADFHQNVLGYELINTICVNAGSAPEGKYDMLNYVLAWPNADKGVLVVTEGMTKESIFYKFLQKYGQGIHHIAYEIEDIEASFELLLDEGIELTSDHILRDPLTGLRQFFISNQYTGVFIELIERKSLTSDKKSEQRGFFTQDNMSGLASTMLSYLDDQTLTEDSNIKDLDQKLYYKPQKQIEVECIESFQINTDELQKAQTFLTNVLGFSEVNGVMINPNEKDKFLELGTNINREEGSIPVEMKLKSRNMENSISILKTLNIDFKKNGNQILLDKSLAGYPLSIIHS